MYYFLTYIFPSSSFKWQPVESLIGTFQAIHKEIFGVMHTDQTSTFHGGKQLFVYKDVHKVLSREGAYGELQNLHVSCLNSLDREMPDTIKL